MSAYSNEVHKLMAAGKSQAEAERTVRRELPHLFTELTTEAAQRRADQRSRSRVRQWSRPALPSAVTSTAATSPDVNAMLSAAVAGSHFSEAEIAAAVRPINRTNAWFRHEVQHRRQNLQDDERERSAKRSAPATVRQPSRGRTADLVSEHNLPFVLPSVRQGFDVMVADAARCEREYSDREIVQAGFDVPTFRDRLATAVLDKVLHRKFQVGAVSCDCSGAGGACVCR